MGLVTTPYQFNIYKHWSQVPPQGPGPFAPVSPTGLGITGQIEIENNGGDQIFAAIHLPSRRTARAGTI